MKDKFRIDFVSRVDSDIFYLNKKDAPKVPLDLFIEILSENKKDLIDN